MSLSTIHKIKIIKIEDRIGIHHSSVYTFCNNIA